MNRLVFSVNSSEREILIEVMKLQSEAVYAILHLGNFLSVRSQLAENVITNHAQ